MKNIIIILALAFFANTAKTEAQTAFTPAFNQTSLYGFAATDLKKPSFDKFQFTDNLLNSSLTEKIQVSSVPSKTSTSVENNKWLLMLKEINDAKILAQKMNSVNSIKPFNPTKVNVLGIPLKGFAQREPFLNEPGLINNTILTYKF
jgi:hypothetical protein